MEQSTHHHTHNDDTDPFGLLSYDPAAVVIRARSDRTTLRKLEKFARRLSRYVGLSLLSVESDDRIQDQTSAGPRSDGDDPTQRSVGAVRTQCLFNSDTDVGAEAGNNGTVQKIEHRRKPTEVGPFNEDRTEELTANMERGVDSPAKKSKKHKNKYKGDAKKTSKKKEKKDEVPQVEDTVESADGVERTVKRMVVKDEPIGFEYSAEEKYEASSNDAPKIESDSEGGDYVEPGGERAVSAATKPPQKKGKSSKHAAGQRRFEECEGTFLSTTQSKLDLAVPRGCKRRLEGEFEEEAVADAAQSAKTAEYCAEMST